MMKISTKLTFTLLFVTFISFSQDPGDDLFDTTKIHEIRIISLYESLADTLTNNYVLSFGIGQIQTRDIPYAIAVMKIDGNLLDTLGVRYKGFNSWWSSVKKPIKVDLNKYKKDQTYNGLSKFNLHNGSGDPSFIRENISYKILRSLGIKAPRTSYAKVYLDNDYIGLYRIVEQVDNTFLDVNFGNHDGNLYAQQSKGSGGYDLSWVDNQQDSYYQFLSLENHQKKNDWSSLIHFLDVLNNTPDKDFRNAILEVFDVDEYLQILAFDIAINNIDWYGSSARNYYLAEVEGKFHWIPWDFNLSWRSDAVPINIEAGNYPVLIKRLLSVPEFYDKFLRKYCELKPYFDNSFLGTIQTEHDFIKSLMSVDPYLDYPNEAFEGSLDTEWEQIPGLKPFATQRESDITTTFESLHVNCSDVTEVPQAVDQVKLYPVPVSDNLIIETTSAFTNVSIYNSIGVLVYDTMIGERASLNLSELSAGWYMVKLNTGSKRYSKVIMVE